MPSHQRLGSAFTCGLYRIEGVDTDAPSAELVHTFPGGTTLHNMCAVPVVVGDYWVQMVPEINAMIALGVSDPTAPNEVRRLNRTVRVYTPSGSDRSTTRGDTMYGDQPTRRRFILAAIAASSAVSGALTLCLIRAGSASAASATDGASVLGRSARLLYPHVAITDEVYAEVIDGILSSAASDPQLTTMLNEAIAALDADGDFLELGDESQLAVMTSFQERPWFATVKLQVLTRLYSHPKLWQLIRYPGPSVPFGGYLDRGFDDIDWLPEDAS